MEYKLQSGPVIKDRYKIGFLDDNQDNDFHIQIMSGIAKAAKKLDIDIVRFSYYSSNIAFRFSQQVDMVLDHIAQYELDGLMFLGWTKAGAMYNYSDFLTRFSSIPLLSIGSAYVDIPNVYFAGEDYIREITRHLIERHRFARIAFIEHHRPDLRRVAYEQTMHQHGLYDPLLYVGEAELSGLDLAQRNKRAVEILFDERKLDVEAIISLNIHETSFLINELNQRGIHVPGDVAVTSYEDADFARYSTPSLTTIYFPWKELGYSACESMVKLLKTGRMPMNRSLTGSGRIIYRESCGCMPYTIRVAENDKKDSAPNGLSDMTPEQTGAVIYALDSLYFDVGIRFDKLIHSFTASCRNRDRMIFLTELTAQLRNVRGNYNIENLISIIRRLFYPYLVHEVDTMLWTGELFMQAQVLVSERAASIYGTRIVEEKMSDRSLQEVGQSLLASFSLQNIIESLEQSLPKMKIPGCYIFVSNSIYNNTDVEENPFESSVLIFKYRAGRSRGISGIPESLSRQLSDLMNDRIGNVSFSYLLHIKDEKMGFALFEPGPIDDTVYQCLTMYISTALRGIVLMGRLNRTYKELVEHAQREGMADVAANVLHNIGNILNSISVSVHLLEESATSSVIDDMILAGRLLQQNLDRLEDFLCMDPRGKKLMQFYLKLGTAADRFQTQLKYNTGRIGDKVTAINGVVMAQQTYAGVDMKLRELMIEPVLEDALKVNEALFEKYGIVVEKDIRCAFSATVNRGKLFFTFMNIMANAKDALLEIENRNRKISISMYMDHTGKYLQFRDNGNGIEEGLSEKIFEYGFSTRSGRHGYGLYSCASYLSDMGASICAESEGKGKGTAFIIRFP